MAALILGILLGLGLFAGPASAETLGDLLKARGITPPRSLTHLDRLIGAYQVLDDERDLLVVYTLGEGESARLHATRFRRAARAWTATPLEWRVPAGGGAPGALEVVFSGMVLCPQPSV